MQDIALNPEGDLFITVGGDIALRDSVRQRIEIRLRWFLGEWMFNESLGVPWFQYILKKQVNLALAEGIVTEQIRQTEGVLDVKRTAIGLEQRRLSVTYDIITTEGEVRGEQLWLTV
jgi:hypothetical protein